MIFYLFQKTSVTDVLKAMGAMPSGFRKPTLGNYLKQGKVFLSSFLSYCFFNSFVSLSVFMLVYLSAFVYACVLFRRTSDRAVGLSQTDKFQTGIPRFTLGRHRKQGMAIFL